MTENRPESRALPHRRWWGAALAALLLCAGGVAYRGLSVALGEYLDQPIRLEPPLASLPMQIGDWIGEDVPISEGVRKIANNDDFVNRLYENSRTRDAVNVYIGYTARPRTMLRHRPTVCYPSAGWSHLESRAIQLPGRAGHPALVHEFSKPGQHELRVLVLNYYVLNGRISIDEYSFWGASWRDPNIGRDASRYVAQIQVTVPYSGSAERAERVATRFAAETAEQVLRLLPSPRQPSGEGAAASRSEGK
jgi:EpsI family protein